MKTKEVIVFLERNTFNIPFRKPAFDHEWIDYGEIVFVGLTFVAAKLRANNYGARIFLERSIEISFPTLFDAVAIMVDCGARCLC